MSNPKLFPTLLTLIVGLVLSGCSRVPASTVETSQPQVTPTLQATSTPQATATPKPFIDLQPCQQYGSSASCGTLRVYENRETRSGRMIDLYVVVIKAQSPKPATDPIFYLAGGPGVAAASEAAFNQQLPYSLSYNHDLVFVDQRGTGKSHQVLLPDPSESPDMSGMTPEQADAAAKAYAAKVLASVDMDPRYYTTWFAMDDLDEVREALGYDKINVYGYSYGATAAQYYLRQHEEHVRTVVLGGGSLLDVPVITLWAQNGQRALDRLFDFCQADPDCQAAYPDIRDEFTALMERLAKQPVKVTFSGNIGSAEITPDYIAPVIRMMIRFGTEDGTIPSLIHRAYTENNWDGFVKYIEAHGNYEWWGQWWMDHEIRCFEKWAAFDPKEVERMSEGSFLKGFDLWLSQQQAGTCQYFPRGITPEGTSPQPESQVPMLILNGGLDPIDPPENMADAKKLFPNSLSLVIPYQGHSWTYSAVLCGWSIEDQFIQSGSVAGLNTDCLKGIPPIRFVTVE